MTKECREQFATFLCEIIEKNPPLTLLSLRSFSREEDVAGVEQILECLLNSEITTLEEVAVSGNHAWAQDTTVKELLTAIEEKLDIEIWM